MNKLSKDQLKEREKLVIALNEASKNIEDAIETYNQKVVELKGVVEKAAEEYNELVRQAQDFASAFAADVEQNYDDMSEREQESDKGQSLQSFLSEWQNADLEEAEIDFPNELECPDLFDGDVLAELPEKAE